MLQELVSPRFYQYSMLRVQLRGGNHAENIERQNSLASWGTVLGGRAYWLYLSCSAVAENAISNKGGARVTSVKRVKLKSVGANSYSYTFLDVDCSARGPF